MGICGHPPARNCEVELVAGLAWARGSKMGSKSWGSESSPGPLGSEPLGAWSEPLGAWASVASEPLGAWASAAFCCSLSRKLIKKQQELVLRN